ncbi:MAG: LamG-like jellyroll fold domain-containing protein [Planctomycetota bacterium]
MSNPFKAPMTCLIGLGIILCLSTAVHGSTLTIQWSATEGVEVLLPFVDLIESDDGQARFAAPGTCRLSETGAPGIPWKTYVVLLPPDAELDGVTCKARHMAFEGAGSIQVEPTPPRATWNDRGEQVVIWPEGRIIDNGYDRAIYSSDAFWPAEPVRVTSTGRLGAFQLVEIAVPLFQYNPVQQVLKRLTAAEISLEFDRAENQALIPSLHGWSKVQKLAVNFFQVSGNYEKALSGAPKSRIPMKAKGTGSSQVPGNRVGEKGYVILTTSAIQSASTELANFVAHKTGLGFDVHLVTESEWGGGTGDSAANNIRAWLQANYIDLDVAYVLLIGSPNPVSGDVAMKICISDHPTDYYFAELTADWDKDGDGIFGEKGEIEKYFEVYVGRIPFYGNVDDLDSILAKTISFENSTDTAWRRNTLLPMVPLDDTTPSYQLGEQIKEYFLEPDGIPSDRIYDETYGLLPPPEYLRAEAKAATVWSQCPYGIIVWSTHGSATGASGIMGSGDAQNLDDDHPGATWQGSCSNSKPENSNNLGYALLKQGAIGTVGATRSSWYLVGEKNYVNTSSTGGMGFQYAKRLVQRQACGDALWNLKQAMQIWMKNYYVFNLYGDPSVVVLPEPPSMIVSPTDPFHTFGVETYPYFLETRTYTVKNNSDQPLDWSVASKADWLEFSIPGSTIPAMTSVDVEISLAAEVDDLPMGIHTAVLTFTDNTDGGTLSREVRLERTAQRLTCHYKLDETMGKAAADTSMLGHSGELLGNCTFNTNSVAGALGSALSLDGSNDCVETPALGLHTNHLTITAWIKPDKTHGMSTGLVVCRDDKTNSGLLIGMSNELGYIWNGTHATWRSGLYIPEDEWSFVALVIEPDLAFLYHLRDGHAPLRAKNKTGHIVEPFGDAIHLGSNNLQNNRYFKGAIDDVRIYNYALSAWDIKALAAGGPANNPYPHDGAKNVGRHVLRWIPGAGAIGSDVYFGTAAYMVNSADKTSKEYKGTVQGSAFILGKLRVLEDYYWRVDTVTQDTVLKGKIWRFTTARAFTAMDLVTEIQTHLTMDDDDISGDTIFDVSGAPVYDGTMDGPVPSAPGMADQALEFDGTNDYVSIPEMNLDSNNVTFSAWVHPDGLQLKYTGIAMCRGGSSNAGLCFFNNNMLAYRWPGEKHHNWECGLVAPVLEWSHVALVVTPEKATVYLNGHPMSREGTHNAEAFDALLRLGSHQGYSGRYFGGLIDDFAFWNRALDEAEIIYLYCKGMEGASF